MVAGPSARPALCAQLSSREAVCEYMLLVLRGKRGAIDGWAGWVGGRAGQCDGLCAGASKDGASFWTFWNVT